MGGPARILVVDDDDDIRTLVCLVLEAEGYRAVPARDGLDALTLLGTDPLPALILLDFMMPRMDGEALVGAIRPQPRLCDIPVVVMSGHNQAVQKTQSLGVAACLVKPVDVDLLLRTVQQCLRPV
jgi:CheY-like chemotaxis protein